MISWELIDSAQVPGNSGELCLYRRGGEFSIRATGVELMNSRIHGSEEALAELACARIAQKIRAHILIGGLGMGYTLAAALKRLGPESRIIVAELVPQVVEWNRGPLAELNGHAFQDERVTVFDNDVAILLKEHHQAYDAILLDVDNGPAGLIQKDNDWLYSKVGLDAACAALRSGGVLAVWSANTDRAFARRLRQAGFAVDEIGVRSRGKKKGRRHTIWLAMRGS